MEVNLEPKQQIAFTTEATEVLYGGAAGGMKSFLLRVSAIRWALEVPGIQVYFFRRTLPDLRDNHLRGPSSFFVMLQDGLKDGRVKYKAQENEFEFVGGGILHLCYCDSENDVEKYRGAEIHVLMVDELTHFSEYQYRFLRSRVRRAGLKVPEKYKGKLPRIEAASNPGSIGHAWVKRSFISLKAPMEIWRAGPEEGGMLRQFIPAKLSDNPYLTRDDPDYANRLRGLGADNLVRAMLDGDWNVVAGQAFEKLTRERHCIEPFDPPADWLCFGSFDWGSSRPFSFGLWTVANGNPLPDGRVYRRGSIIRYNEWYGWNGKPNEGLRMEVKEVAEGILKKCRGRKLAYIVADPAIWKVDGGPSHAETMMRYGVILRKADNSREPGYIEVRNRISGDEEGPMLYATSNCQAGFWRTMPDMIMDENHPEDVDTEQEDHCLSGDTLVDVRGGAKPIRELVGTEGEVWTPLGWKRYTRCRKTRRAGLVRVSFKSGSVVCTGDHRFLSRDAWVDAKDLMNVVSYSSISIGDEAWLKLSAKRRKSLTESVTGFADFISSGRARDCIGLYGKAGAALCLMGITSIIKMATEAIISSQIWSFLRAATIFPFMPRPLTTLPPLPQCNQPLKNGTQAMLALSGIGSITNKSKRLSIKNWIWSVRIAAANFLQDPEVASVLAPAKLSFDGRTSWITSKNHVLYAGQRLEQTSSTRVLLALQNAPGSLVQMRAEACDKVEELGEDDVYCLDVPEAACFSVNGGFFVHNCYDETRYACMSRPWMTMNKPKEPPPDRWMRFEEKEEETWKTA